MNNIAIILSSDYELYGDGSGDVKQAQIDPTNSMLKVVDSYAAKLTVMFEYGQYLAYLKHAGVDNDFEHCNKLIREQLIDLIKNGHDVQLHYHAQWNNAKYEKNNKKFILNLDHVDITSLEYDELVAILKDGKSFLEQLLKPFKSNYECIGFRAGSWAVKNEKKLMKALKECNFKVDSSVVPNTKFESEQVNFEYSNSPHQYLYWYIDESLSCRNFKTNFIEIPIYTKKSPLAFLKYANLKYKTNRLALQENYKVKISEKNYSFFHKIKKILTRNYYMADLDTMTYKTLIKMVDEAYTKVELSDDRVTPLMFISHSKTAFVLDDLKLFFEYVKNKYKDEVYFCTLQEVTEKILNQSYECLYINIIKSLDDNISNFLPILGKKEYLETKSNDYGWFTSGKYILPYYIDKKFIFKRLIFSTAPISKESNLANNDESIFINDVVKFIRDNKMCDFIYKAQSNVVFNVCPDNSDCVRWGTYQVNLQKTENELFKSFDSKARNVIRKAIKEGVVVKEEEDAKVIYQNIKETLERQKSIHYPSLEYITKISKLKDSAKCFVVVKEDIIQGSLLLLYDSKCGYAMYAGSIKSPQTGSIDLLHFEAMKFCQSNNILNYDFVGTRINIKKGSKQEGIDRFKRKFKPVLIEGKAFKTVIKPLKYKLYSYLVSFYFRFKGYKYLDPIEQIDKEEAS